jgi:anti-sigma regulatory factor (Ser/Thr protein kinase)
MRASFKREIGSVTDVHDLVSEFFSCKGIDADQRYAVDLAVEEIFTNMVKYNRATDCEIDVELVLHNDRLTIRLTDPQTEPFDITAASNVEIDLPLQERPIGGLGLHLVKSLMDEVDYDHTERRSTVTLVKRI